MIGLNIVLLKTILKHFNTIILNIQVNLMIFSHIVIVKENIGLDTLQAEV